MTEYFKNKFRIHSTRKENWDYSEPGVYFITICSYKMKKYFGRVVDGKMELSPAGMVLNQCWMEIPQHFHHVRLGEFVIMPNHLHGILILNHRVISEDEKKSASEKDLRQHSMTLKQRFMSSISPKPGSLAVVIGSCKSAVSKRIRRFDPGFKWKDRFHDKIVRVDSDYSSIETYIKNNPRNWNKR